jgi:hypothetical protein
MKTLSLVSFAALLTTGSLAFAGDPKAPAPKAPDKAAAPAMATPKIPTEIADMGKVVNGTWKCKGTTMNETGKSVAMEATIKTTTDGYWITDAMEAKADKTNFKMQSFTTYDATAKKWRRVAVDSMGAQMIGTAEASKDGKVTFNLDMTGPMGAGQFKDEMDASDAKKGVKFAGKMSMDKGKTWMPVYEMTCTK